MPAAIVITVGAANANSYITVVDCESYLDDQINGGAFAALANADDKTRALLAAARELDLIRWVGKVVDDVQALQWPRDDAPNPDSAAFQEDFTLSQDDRDFSTTEIPQRVIDAQCEIALEIVTLGTVRFTTLPTSNEIKRSKVSVLETEFVDQHQKRTGLDRFPRVMNLIGPLIDAAVVATQVVRM